MEDKKLEKEVLDEMEEKNVEEETLVKDAADSEGTEETAEVCSEEETEEQGEEKEAESSEETSSDKKKKDPKDEKLEELNDKYQRLFAEFQNYRNRSEKEKSSMFDMGARNIIEKFLPIVDNFERGIASLSEEDLKSPVGQGMDMIFKQMEKTLGELGVEAIEAQGKEFDPELHNAVMQVESEEFESGVVAQELQKGYMYKDQVVRHSMVAVVS